MAQFMQYLHYVIAVLVDVAATIVLFKLVARCLNKKKQKAASSDFSKKYNEDHKYAFKLRCKKLIKEIEDRLADKGIKLLDNMVNEECRADLRSVFWLEAVLVEIESIDDPEELKKKIYHDEAEVIIIKFPCPVSDVEDKKMGFYLNARLMTEEEKMKRAMLKDLHLLP